MGCLQKIKLLNPVPVRKLVELEVNLFVCTVLSYKFTWMSSKKRGFMITDKKSIFSASINSSHLFNRFDEKESVSGTQQLKSSVQKGIRNRLVESFPSVGDHFEKILPKKDAFRIVKW